MGKISKKQLKPHLVIVDTNILWNEDKTKVVNSTFESFWTKYSKPFKLELLIPEVVKGEILFQQSTEAINSVKRATHEINKVSRITDKKYSLRIEEHKIKSGVEKRFDKWLNHMGGRCKATPVDKINWQDLIKQAIWREPPFEYSPEKSDVEKGFRDSLIMETVADICSRDNRQIGIVFICNDKLLRETTHKKLSLDSRFNCYDSVESLESYLKLTKEELEDQFITSLLKRATQKFFSKDNPHCLYLREKLRNKLQNDYKKYFDNPKESEKDFVRSFLLSTYSESWEPMDSGMFWISNAQFERIESTNEYYWMSQVTFVKQYIKRYEGTSLLRSLTTMFQDDDKERVLILPFHIIWKAKVAANGRFSDLALVNIELKDNSFERPTEQQRKFWRLKSLESMNPASNMGPVSGSQVT